MSRVNYNLSMKFTQRFFVFIGVGFIWMLIATGAYTPAFASDTNIKDISAEATEKYFQGRFEEALTLFLKAAELGDTESQYNAGLMYGKGEGAPPNSALAAQWIKKAAEQGYSQAQFGLGSLYYKGDGVPQNYDEAAQWFQKSADQGHSDSQFF